MWTLRFGCFGRCRVDCSRMIATIAIGNAMKKFQRQPKASVTSPPRRGPPTVPTAMTAPNRPAYLPRSRGLMMSAMMIWLSAARPPPPRPWKTRNRMSMFVSCEKPAAADPTTKSPSESWMSSLRLNRSANLPHSGVDTVVARRVDVTTHVYADWSPLSSEMMSGNEVATTVPARIDTNMPRRRPERDSSTWRWVMVPSADTVRLGGLVLLARVVRDIGLLLEMID